MCSTRNITTMLALVLVISSSIISAANRDNEGAMNIFSPTTTWQSHNHRKWFVNEGHLTARIQAVWMLDLSKDQKSKIRMIQRELRANHWDLEDKTELASDLLIELYKASPRDAEAIGDVYDKIFKYRRQIIVLSIEAGNKIEAVLTTKQRERLKQFKPEYRHKSHWDPR